LRVERRIGRGGGEGEERGEEEGGEHGGRKRAHDGKRFSHGWHGWARIYGRKKRGRPALAGPEGRKRKIKRKSKI
jgi:hypothetical protein